MLLRPCLVTAIFAGMFSLNRVFIIGMIGISCISFGIIHYIVLGIIFVTNIPIGIGMFRGLTIGVLICRIGFWRGNVAFRAIATHDLQKPITQQAAIAISGGGSLIRLGICSKVLIPGDIYGGIDKSKQLFSSIEGGMYILHMNRKGLLQVGEWIFRICAERL